MSAREIRILGDPILRKEVDAVDAVDDDIRTLISDMFETMYRADGVGLAAPQVGVEQRVIVVDPREPEIEPLALINPQVVDTSEDTERGEEGCLSIPGMTEIVERPAHAVVEALDREGETVRIEADGLLSRVLQHEVDHLDGILFFDRISPLKRRMLLKKWKKQQKQTAGAS